LGITGLPLPLSGYTDASIPLSGLTDGSLTLGLGIDTQKSNE